MADSVEVSTIETTDGTIGIIRDNAARQSIANLREGKETVGSVAWENVKGRPTKVSELENDKKYQTDENVSNTLNSTLYAGSSTHGGPATSADKLTTARTISLGGAAAGSGSFDGSANSTINVSSLDATKLTGIVSITNLPPSVVERMSVVKDDTERFALTKDKVQDGDVVKVQSSGLIYYVVDDDKLNEESGYEVFKAGTAASVPWGGVTGKPSSYPPSSHTHTKSQITDFPSSLPNPSNLTMQIEGTDAAVYNGGTSQTFNVTKSSLGLDKVNNTADADKSVKYASSAGTVNDHTINSDVPAGAVFTDHTYNFDGVWFTSGNSNAGTHDANAMTHNGTYYYTSNGPSGLGESTTDGALYSQAYSDTWVGQIAQDYKNGNLFTRGKNNGIWQPWKAVAYKELASQSSNGLMSAADKKAIDREFFRMVPKGGTVIHNGANLNSTAYIKVGTYYQLAIVNTSNMTNIPVKTAFIMYVLSPLAEAYDNESTAQWVYRLRIFVGFDGKDIYVQRVSSGSTAGDFKYDPWVKMTNSNDLAAVSKIINDHIANKSNPHGVTKAQVGLGNVDNTADKDKSVKYAMSAGSAGSADTVDGFHEYSFLRYRDATSTNGAGTLWSQIGIREYDNALPSGLSGLYNWGAVVSLPSDYARFDLYYNRNSSENGDGLYYRTGWGTEGRGWVHLIDSQSIGSQSVNYANSAASVPWGGVTDKPSSYPPSGHNHSYIGQIDTRDTNQTPNWYYSNYGHYIVNEFKYNSSIGLPISPMYSELVTIVPWGDSSGGNVIQLAVDYSTNTLYIRSGTGDTWGSWKSTGGSKSAKYTLTASKWSGSSAPYTYDLGSTYGNNSVIGFDSAVGSTAQLEAARAADIQGSSTTKIYAYGDKPTVDIPIVIIYQ